MKRRNLSLSLEFLPQNEQKNDFESKEVFPNLLLVNIEISSAKKKKPKKLH